MTCAVISVDLKEGTAMKRKISKKAVAAIVLCAAVTLAAVPTAVFLIRGNNSGVQLPAGFEEELSAQAFENSADVRIMSSNLLVHYKSWGGTPAKPRAKQYTKMLELYSPDVVGIQEMSDSWYCLLQNNLPKKYKMLFPFSSGALVRMTAMIYNSETLSVVDSGNFKYKDCDNPRLRRVVWAVFEVKASGKRFAVTNTHFDLLRDGREAELTEVMRSQEKELVSFADELNKKYNCPVMCVGDFNTMEDTPETREIDIPEIYNSLAADMTDAKFSCKTQVCGDKQAWDYPSYDHVFIKGGARADTFALLSYDCLSEMSDHYPIFADIAL